MNKVGPAFNNIRGQESDVPVESGKLSLVHGLDEIATGSTRRPLANLLVDFGKLLIRTQTLEHNPPRALPGLPVLGEEHVLYIEDI